MHTNVMARVRFIVLVILMANYSWGIRPERFKAVLDRRADIEVTLAGNDFTGVKSKDANPYVDTYREMLADIGNLLTKHKIVWHITFGTLIGWQRMKRFLPYDEDLDVYIANKVFEEKDLFERFQKDVAALNKGYKFIWSLSHGLVYRVTKVITNGMTLDARGRGPKGEGTWVDMYHYGNCNQDHSLCEGYKVPKQHGHDGRLEMHKLLPPKKCTIDGIAVMCPKNPAYLLDAYYGKNKWRTPKVKYCEGEGEWKVSCAANSPGKQSESAKVKTANPNPEKDKDKGEVIKNVKKQSDATVGMAAEPNTAKTKDEGKATAGEITKKRSLTDYINIVREKLDQLGFVLKKITTSHPKVRKRVSST